MGSEQRGNARRFILDSDSDRMAYLNLLRQNIALHGVGLIGYCLMSNHVHLVVTPHNADGLALALRHAHGRYAIYWNAVHQSSGHAWQGRYYSCPLDRVHLWERSLYGVESGAGRFGGRGGSVEVVQRGSALRSGSAGRDSRFGGMAKKLGCQCLAAVPSGRRDGIQADGDSSVHPPRAAAGTTEFVQALEGSMKRRLAPQKGGRPKTGLPRSFGLNKFATRNFGYLVRDRISLTRILSTSL
jgi:REP element-mobilizing transposase RayT